MKNSHRIFAFLIASLILFFFYPQMGTGSEVVLSGLIEKETLEEAAFKGDTTTVKALLAKGVNVNEKRKKGTTPLIAAARSGHLEIVNLLLAAGAEVDPKTGPKRVGQPTALWWAARNGHQVIVETLLENGADVNGKEGKLTPTALMEAVERGHPFIVEVLLIGGANPNEKNAYGRTALWMAAILGRTKAVEILLENGADVNTTGEIGLTPLMLAVDSWKFKYWIVKALLENGADVNMKDKGGNTASMFAKKRGYDEFFQLLKDTGREK